MIEQTLKDHIRNSAAIPSRVDARTKLLLVALSQGLKAIGGALKAIALAIDAYIV